MGAAEIAALLGVTRQRVNQLAKKDDFPEPVAVLAGGKVWLEEEVERWAKRTGRL